MIAKFEGIPGSNLSALLTFIHGDENRVAVPRQAGQLMIVRVKAVNPDNQGGGTWYGLTLDILEWTSKGDQPGENRVDSKYLLKVYEILGQDRLTSCVSKKEKKPEDKDAKVGRQYENVSLDRVPSEHRAAVMRYRS
jgi:hypothetical protein